MKNNIQWPILLILLIINSIIGILLSSYRLFNWVSSDIVLILSTIIITILNKSKANEGMKISLNFILTFFSICSFILASLTPYKIKDNFTLILLIVSIGIQFSIAIVPIFNTTKNKKDGSN